MTHGEKMARAALERWLKLYRELETCKACIAPKEQCHKHGPSMQRLAEQTRKLLESGPN